MCERVGVEERDDGSARLSHFGMTTDEMRFINEQQLRRMNYLPYKKRI